MTGKLYFKLADWPTLLDDIDDVGQAVNGQPLTFTDRQGTRRPRPRVNRTRFSWVYDPDLVIVPAEYDADGNQTKAPVTGGPHLRVLVFPHGQANAEHDQLRADLDDYIRGLPWDALDTPQAALDRLGLTQDQIQTYRHTTPRGTSVIVRGQFDEQGNVVGHTTVPERPKGGWA